MCLRHRVQGWMIQVSLQQDLSRDATCIVSSRIRDLLSSCFLIWLFYCLRFFFSFSKGPQCLHLLVYQTHCGWLIGLCRNWHLLEHKFNSSDLLESTSSLVTNMHAAWTHRMSVRTRKAKFVSPIFWQPLPPSFLHCSSVQSDFFLTFSVLAEWLI